MSHRPANPATRKVLLVEDSRRMQEILTWSVETVQGLELAGVADSFAEALAEFDRHNPDVVIVDLALREGSGLDVLREIRHRGSPCRILVFTTYDSEPYRTRSLAAGADYFFSKNKQHRELVQTLQELGAQSSELPDRAAPERNDQPGVDHV